ncbi:MAG: flagellar biosynthesis protein FlhB [Fibrobacterota bacterium]
MPKEGEGGEKTESPTPKKRQDARKDGNVVKSQEIGHVVVLLSGVVFLRFYFDTIYKNVSGLITHHFRAVSAIPADLHDGSFDIMPVFMSILILFLKTALPVALIILAAGVLSNLAQVGFLLTFKPLQPKLSKINPIKGFGKFFSPRSIVDTVKNILKLVIISWVAYVTIKNNLEVFYRTPFDSFTESMVQILMVGYEVALKIIITLIIVAILDYAYQKYDYEENLKMTKQEVKEEGKQQEGSPEVKKRIRQLQQEAANRRMMDEVPDSTVVVTNPTHLSIAIKYDESMSAPEVTAKGADNIAFRIREVAKEHDIPIVEDKPLARGLYDKIQPGDQIPVEYFDAVAELIAYVYRLKGEI